MSRNRYPHPFLPACMLAGVALMFAVPMSAQTASYTYINQKAPYKNPSWQTLVALNLPKLGSTFRVQVPNNASMWTHGPRYLLALGMRNPDLPIPALGGYLFTSAEVVVYPYGRLFQPWVTVSYPIPNSSRLLGVRFYQQVLNFYSCGPGPCPKPYLSVGGAGVMGR